VVFHDDAQVVDLVAMKRYATVGESPHVELRVELVAAVVPLPQDQPLFAGGSSQQCLRDD
jgi:hypothetical protein